MKIFVNLVRLITVAEGAIVVEMLGFVVDFDDDVDNATAFVFEHVVVTAFAGPH